MTLWTTEMASLLIIFAAVSIVVACPPQLPQQAAQTATGTRTSSKPTYRFRPQQVMMKVVSKRYWTSDKSKNDEYLDELKNELMNYATSQGINFNENYVQPEEDRESDNVVVTYKATEGNCDETKKFVRGAKQAKGTVIVAATVSCDGKSSFL